MSPVRDADVATERRVRVYFGEHLLREYKADQAAALRYAHAIGRRFPGLLVTVDGQTVEGLAQLPCEQLWTLLPP
ncbi:hypothetical protein BKA15_005332 [Microlunatus parietis]|uniref:Uncharacterized protein n=1 Tax=Microlunatus parietis TaxID=682979 RepID=A0A7Y9ICC8_9ACTN|nr:hypothetical protein [Microlunatus parietis]